MLTGDLYIFCVIILYFILLKNHCTLYTVRLKSKHGFIFSKCSILVRGEASQEHFTETHPVWDSRLYLGFINRDLGTLTFTFTATEHSQIT